MAYHHLMPGIEATMPSISMRILAKSTPDIGMLRNRSSEAGEAYLNRHR